MPDGSTVLSIRWRDVDASPGEFVAEFAPSEWWAFVNLVMRARPFPQSAADSRAYQLFRSAE